MNKKQKGKEEGERRREKKRCWLCVNVICHAAKSDAHRTYTPVNVSRVCTHVRLDQQTVTIEGASTREAEAKKKEDSVHTSEREQCVSYEC